VPCPGSRPGSGSAPPAPAASPGRTRRRGAQLAEQLLQAGGGDQLQHPGGRIPRVPEGVPLPAGLEDQVPRLGDDLPVAQQLPKLALEHVAVLVLTGVVVQRAGQHARWQGVPDDREPAAGIGAVDHEPVGAGPGAPATCPSLDPAPARPW
jgi:hypothetical protein